MKKSNTNKPDIILAFILLLPALFLLGFTIRAAMMPTMTCKQGCDNLGENFIGCSEDICLCQRHGAFDAIQVKTIVVDNTTHVVECTE